MYFILFYETVDNFIEKREPHREEHLAYASAAHERGDLVMAGALTDPSDTAVLVFKGEDIGMVEAFAKFDPYVTNGLVSRWHVRQWQVAFGG